MKSVLICFLSIALSANILVGQIADRWQQRAEYKMEIDFNHKKHQFSGTQKLKYFNNSPDTLTSVFYHLYFNAFQPESMMDIRSRTIDDPDSRVGARIYYLEKEDQGYQNVTSLNQDGKPCRFITEGTILEVQLNQPILPGKKAVFDMKFDAQVPLQVRRSGRMNKEGIDYSMAQWYPKLCEYDYQGWHANPYIGREFHGVWGDFDVKINIDSKFVLAGSGVLQNKNSIGRGYQENGKKVKNKKGKTTWHFKADNVHDFVWAADPDYVVKQHKSKAGVMFYFVYKPGEKTTDNWSNLPKIMDSALSFMNNRFGKYPYPVYSFIQGGDGGMEYPMATLITGERSFPSLVGVSVHEMMHSWYQEVLATNESLYPWMDEGFTSFGSTEVMNYLRANKYLKDREADTLPFKNTIFGFSQFALSGKEEAIVTHADHFDTNRAYGIGSYTKGQIFLKQLEYIMGEGAFSKGIKRYYNTWKFKHPNPNDFVRVMEKSSGLELDWYKEYWINTTRTIDYAIENVIQEKPQKALILLKKNGTMPMPLDILLTYEDGSTETVNVPLRIMRGQKSDPSITIAKDWAWTNAVYLLKVNTNNRYIVSAQIDPTFSMADTDWDNNTWEQ